MSTASGLVLRARSGFYTVATDDGDLVEARLRGRVKKERQTSDLAVIGDRVVVERLPDGTGAIGEVLPRRSRFSRRQPGPRGAWRELERAVLREQRTPGMRPGPLHGRWAMTLKQTRREEMIRRE